MPTYSRDPATIRRCHKLAAKGDVINLTAILAKLKVRVRPDERDPTTLDTALHVAARAGVRPSLEQPLLRAYWGLRHCVLI